jgi:hypothetical protein
MSRGGNWGWTPIAGAIFGIGAVAAAPVIGLGIAAPAGVLQADSGWAAPLLGSFVVATIVWWLIIGWPRRLSLARGAFAGALVGLCAYPVVLAIADFGQGKPVDVATLGARSFGILELIANDCLRAKDAIGTKRERWEL